MGRPTLNLSNLALFATLVVVVPTVRAQSATAENATEPVFPRVRTTNPGIAPLLRRGREASPTFQRLIATIDRTDGIVFVEEGRCGHSVRACLLLSVTFAGPNRVLRIYINTHDTEREVIASIAHELWHAIEALREASVRDTRTMFNFFQREGPTACGRFETDEAVHVGLDVRTELGAAKR